MFVNELFYVDEEKISLRGYIHLQVRKIAVFVNCFEKAIYSIYYIILSNSNNKMFLEKFPTGTLTHLCTIYKCVLKCRFSLFVCNRFVVARILHCQLAYMPSSLYFASLLKIILMRLTLSTWTRALLLWTKKTKISRFTHLHMLVCLFVADT